MAVVKLKTG